MLLQLQGLHLEVPLALDDLDWRVAQDLFNLSVELPDDLITLLLFRIFVIPNKSTIPFFNDSAIYILGVGHHHLVDAVEPDLI